MSLQHSQPRRMAPLLARVAVCLLACAWLLGPAQVARANSIIVTSSGDTFDPQYPCNLRDAITAANTNSQVNGCQAGQSGLDTITFDWGLTCAVIICTLILTGMLPTVIDDLTIDGAGLNPTISGDHLYRIFAFGGVSASLSNLRLINGNAGDGGAIHVAGATLTLDHVDISDSQATYGGAIFTESGTLFVSHSDFINNSGQLGGAIDIDTGTAIISSSRFFDNVASYYGGAIGVISNTHLAVTGSLFDGNRARFSGGAIYAQMLSTQTSVANSTFTHNQTLTQTTYFGGGAIYDVGVLTLTTSTLVGNVSASEGGALYIRYGQATVRNTTISGNTAQGSGGAIAAYSGDASFPAVLNLNNVTLSDNTADLNNSNLGDGGGLAITSSFVTAIVSNSILAGNLDNSGPNYPDCSGQLAALHFSLIGLSDGCTVAPGQSGNNKVGTGISPLDALLGPLADNGGPTQTRALLAGSPALNAASPAAPGSGGLACASTDQRGLPRPNGPTCDIGAFEAGGRIFLPAVRK